MSLYDVEHVADKMTCTVECCECDKVETIEILESTTIAELESHLCVNCSDPLTIDKFHALVNQYWGGLFPRSFVIPYFKTFFEEIMKSGSKVNTVYEYIQDMNLNDQKTRGI